jgi:hypothetical protein
VARPLAPFAKAEVSNQTRYDERSGRLQVVPASAPSTVENSCM